MKGIVYNVQRFSVHDGPGIRTLVFLKGCPLHCRWCANPESQSAQPQIAYNDSKCIGAECLLCQRVCANRAIFYPGAGAVEVQHNRCNNCLKCSMICPAKAITTYGEYKTVKEVVDDVEKDMAFYQNSKGGMTLSGGEPLAQAEFTREHLKEEKKRRIHTAVETCGYYPDWEQVKDIFAYVDYVLYDVKSMNTLKHKAYTGVDNEIILKNLQALRKEYPTKPIRVRTPLVPGFNDTDEEVLAIADFVHSLPQMEYEVLKYHRFGINKYTYIGREYPMDTTVDMPEERFAHFKKLVGQE